MPDEPTRLDKFKEAARQLETDDTPERFKERVGKLVKHKPVWTKTGEQARLPRTPDPGRHLRRLPARVGRLPYRPYDRFACAARPGLCRTEA